MSKVLLVLAIATAAAGGAVVGRVTAHATIVAAPKECGVPSPHDDAEFKRFMQAPAPSFGGQRF
jgi:hypothetical protein